MKHELSWDFLETIPEAMREIRTELLRSPSAELTIPQYRVLSRLAKEAQNNKQLAESLGVTVANMSRLVQGMVQRKLVVGTPNKTDRREVLLSLSPKGRKLFESMRKETRENLESRFQILTLNEQQSLQEALQLMQKMLRKI